MQDLADTRPDQIRDDDEARCVEHVDPRNEIGDRKHGSLRVGVRSASAAQRSRCPARMGVAAIADRSCCRRRLSVGLARQQDARGVIAHHVDGGQNQGDRSAVRRMGPRPAQSVVIAGSLAMVAAGKRIDVQTILQLVAKPVEASQQVQVPLHCRGGTRRPSNHRARREPVLKLQQRRRVEIGEPGEAFLVHPAQERTEGEEVLPDGAWAQRQTRAWRTIADEADQLSAGPQQRSIASVGEAPPVTKREVPAQPHRFPLVESVGRREDPDHVLPVGVPQKPRATVAAALISTRRGKKGIGL